MPDTKDYPRNKKGKSAYISKCIAVVKKENPSKSLDAIIGQCEGMWRNKWNEKKKSNASLTEEEFWASYNWETCAECLEKEKSINKNNNILEIDIPNKKF